MKRFVTLFVCGLLLTAGSTDVKATEITGAGSTFVYPILSKWSAAYQGVTGDSVGYQSIGSGGGIAKIKAGTVDFGASDMPLKSDELATLALQALNPDVKLPDAGIAVVHRSDGSGTTFNWVNYLSKVSTEWRNKVGEGTAVDWPIGFSGRGNEGVAVFVGQIKNSIGYVEYAYALHYHMTFGLVENKAGRFVQPSAESFQAAAEGFDWARTKDFYLVMTDADGEQAYPITATTFILMYKKPKDVERSKVALQFFKWALEQGQKQAEELDYARVAGEADRGLLESKRWRRNVAERQGLVRPMGGADASPFWGSGKISSTTSEGRLSRTPHGVRTKGRLIRIGC